MKKETKREKRRRKRRRLQAFEKKLLKIEDALRGRPEIKLLDIPKKAKEMGDFVHQLGQEMGKILHSQYIGVP